MRSSQITTIVFLILWLIEMIDNMRMRKELKVLEEQENE